MNKYKKNKYLFYFFVVLTLVLLICYAFYRKNLDNFNNYKIEKEKNLVYTKSKKNYDFYKQYKPFVNIKGELGDVVNKDIDNYMSNFKEDNIGATYEYSLSGEILSLIIKVEDHSYVESATIYYYRSYNINLKTSEIIDNDKLFSYYDINNEQALNVLNKKIEEYYNKSVDEGYVDSDNCNYNCFLEGRFLTEDMDDVEYYVKDGKLYAYKPFTFVSIDGSTDGIVYRYLIAK